MRFRSFLSLFIFMSAPTNSLSRYYNQINIKYKKIASIFFGVH